MFTFTIFYDQSFKILIATPPIKATLTPKYGQLILLSFKLYYYNVSLFPELYTLPLLTIYNTLYYILEYFAKYSITYFNY